MINIFCRTFACALCCLPLNIISAGMLVSHNSKKMKAKERKADLHGRVKPTQNFQILDRKKTQPNKTSLG